MTTATALQGPLQPGQSFDAWCLAGMLLRAEAERDKIQDARWRHKQGGESEPSPYLGAAFAAWMRTRSSLPERALRVALGTHSFEWACCLICVDCPEHHEALIDDLRNEVATVRYAIDRQLRSVEWRVRPLCDQRAPGEQIVAAAETVPGPLPRQRIVEFCRQIAVASRRRRPNARR